jgi:hypothetical protein
MFLEVFSGVDTWYSYLLKIVTKLKIIEQGKFARKHPQYRHIKANLPDNQWFGYQMKLKQIIIPMVKLLEDAATAEAMLDQSDTQFSRRAYVRSIFSSTEGIIWLIKQVCLKAPVVGGVRRMEAGEYALLQDQGYDLKNNGEIAVQMKFLRLPDNFRFTVRVFNRLFRATIDLEVGKQPWSEFLQALKIRHRITHPKDVDSLEISDSEVEICRRVSSWMNDVFYSIVQSITSGSKAALEEAEQKR